MTNALRICISCIDTSFDETAAATAAEQSCLEAGSRKLLRHSFVATSAYSCLPHHICRTLPFSLTLVLANDSPVFSMCATTVSLTKYTVADRVDTWAWKSLMAQAYVGFSSPFRGAVSRSGFEDLLVHGHFRIYLPSICSDLKMGQIWNAFDSNSFCSISPSYSSWTKRFPQEYSPRL